MSNQDTTKLAKQNNQQIRDAAFWPLFPLRGGSHKSVVPDIVNQMRGGNGAFVSLSNLIDEMHNVERPAASVKRGSREPL